MLLPLVEIESGFLSALQVEPVVEAVDVHPARLPRRARARVHLDGQALELANVCVVAKNDLGRLRQLREQVADDGRALFHGERLDLRHECVAELVHHHAGQVIGLGPDQPLEIPQPGPSRESPAQCAAYVVRVKRLTLAAQPPPDDLRLAVVDAGAEAPVGPVAAFDHLAIVLGGQQGLAFVGEHPGVAVERAGFDVGLELQGGRHARDSSGLCRHFEANNQPTLTHRLKFRLPSQARAPFPARLV